MRWLGIGIMLGIGFMLTPYLVSGVWAVVQTAFLMIAVGVYMLVKAVT